MLVLFSRNHTMWQLCLAHYQTSYTRASLNPSCVWSTIKTNVCAEPVTPILLEIDINSNWIKEILLLKCRYACIFTDETVFFCSYFYLNGTSIWNQLSQLLLFHTPFCHSFSWEFYNIFRKNLICLLIWLQPKTDFLQHFTKSFFNFLVPGVH